MASNISSLKDTCPTSIQSVSMNEFDQVISAILEGRYSWACVLLLYFSGYNPAQYIPYRTYRRLLKRNDICDPKMKDELQQ
ncbi:MAG: HetP family heterocyst commitment protein [Leptolyngbyaceae cyanobacterium SM2_5_2]|nr:HetP family heterocyst commitment protein [Leptolyngbyaceae cyanobacterium SM2_5_2]